MPPCRFNGIIHGKRAVSAGTAILLSLAPGTSEQFWMGLHLTRNAVNDLEELDTWISTDDSPERVDYVIDSVSEVLQKLTKLPERGTYPKELSAMGIQEFREVFFKPYRIIYRVKGHTIYIYLIADGRRDMQTLLSRRLLTD